MKLIVVFGSSMGNTESAAVEIASKMGCEAVNVADTDAATINTYDGVIAGSSTWGSGDLQDDWDGFDFTALNLSGKKAAIFGMGDSQSYSDTYCNSIAHMKIHLEKAGATIVGAVSTEGYDFEESESVEGDHFFGLALDNDNFEDKTSARIDAWVEELKKEFV